MRPPLQDITALTQNKHQIIICRSCEPRNAPKDGEVHKICGISGKKIADKTTLVGQNNGLNTSNSVAQHAKGKRAHQRSNEKQGLTNSGLVGILAYPVELLTKYQI